MNSFDPKELPKTLHLLDDSVVEDTSKILAINHVDLPSPTSDLPPLEASLNTAENSTLLTR